MAGKEILCDINDQHVSFFPFSSDAEQLWAIHSVRTENGSIYSSAYRCYGYVTLNSRLQGVNCFVIQSGCCPWQLRIVGCFPSDRSGAWCVVAAANEQDAMALQESADQVNRLFPSKHVSKSVRYRILARDGFKCRYCGSSPDDGAKLHVDHIVPVSRGGSDEESNLCAACSDCNLGKGNRFQSAPPGATA
jgi:hypothetical protein